MPISKKIHYCWLSGDQLPENLQKCLQTWRDKMPDYELVLWDKNKFDIDSVTWVRDACRAKKWAFAADYVRLYALYTEGGIYLDTDVAVLKSFNDFLQYSFFSAVEYVPHAAKKQKVHAMLDIDGCLKKQELCTVPGIGIQAAIMGAQKGHPYLKDCMKWYEKQHFILPNGKYNTEYLAPAVYAYFAIKYGFRYRNELQKLKDNMIIFPPSVLASNNYNPQKDTYAVHLCNDSWNENNILKYLRRNNFLRKLLGKRPLFTIDDIAQSDFLTLQNSR